METKQPDRVILIGGIIILAIGATSAAINKKPETPVLVGSIGFVLLLSLVSTLGAGWSKLAVALTGLALTTVVLVEAPSLFQAIQNAQSGKDTGIVTEGTSTTGANTPQPVARKTNVS